MRILVVEDEKLLADSIGELLKSSGFEVEIVYDGEAGVEYGTLDIYDLIVLDVMMPKLDGYQVARQLRANRLGTPILMLTAKSELDDRITGLNVGADYYLGKPFDNRELLPASMRCFAVKGLRLMNSPWEIRYWISPVPYCPAAQTKSVCRQRNLISCDCFFNPAHKTFPRRPF